jgi:hypothetical protein
MPIHIDEMTSEVTTETADPGSPTGATTHWEERARVRDMALLIAQDARRTSAEDYDD